MPTILILPGLQNSGADHWQTRWQQMPPNAHRVQQRDWEAPDRNEWVGALDAAIAAADGPVTLAAHSLGCALAVWWAARHGRDAHARKVTGALLVAPPDVERPGFPACVTGFAPLPRMRLPFRATVLASSDDPWCALPRARSWAEEWGAQFHDIGPHGHINSESRLGDWPQGRQWLMDLAPHT